MQKTFKRIIAIVFLAIFAFPGSAASRQAADESFYEANEAYKLDEFDKAIKLDESITSKGLSSANLYYNLGNAYFKRGDMGKALLNYERARRLKPGDSDILANYQYAKSQMKQQDMTEKRAFVLRWLDFRMSYITLKQNVMIAFLFYCIIIAYFIVARVFKKYNNYSTFILPVLCFVLIIILVPLFHKIKNLNQGAITISKITDARFEPSADAPVNFPLYEGMKVYILRTQGSWQKVKRPDGKIGWVKASAVELVGL